jgi:hypothetical protein
MSDPITPTTYAGRALLAQEDYNSRSFHLITPEAILEVEAEASERAWRNVAALRQRLEEVAYWLETEVAHPRADPHPAMVHQAQSIRAVLAEIR